MMSKRQIFEPTMSSSDELPLVIKKLSALLDQKPSEFQITILPTVQNNDDDNDKPSSQQLSLDESIVLIDGKYLGLDARTLPWITREIRQCYKRCRKADDKNVMNSLRQEILLSVTRCLLLVNPDHATAWADRRRCCCSISTDRESSQDCWQQEVVFLNLLMTQHSKA